MSKLNKRIEEIQRITNDLMTETILLNRYKTEQVKEFPDFQNLSSILYSEEDKKEITEAFIQTVTMKQIKNSSVADLDLFKQGFIWGWNWGKGRNK